MSLLCRMWRQTKERKHVKETPCKANLEQAQESRTATSAHDKARPTTCAIVHAEALEGRRHPLRSR